MTDEIDIPASAEEPKPLWPDRPSEDVVKHALAFIKRTGKPHLWPGHTHTKPPRGATVIYLAEFDLPTAFHVRELFAPCPCCTPRHPKYCAGGKIGYFPDEKVIRMLGPDCFKSINAEGHVKALKQYHAEVQRKKDIAYLLDHLGKVPELISAIEHAHPTAEAVDDFRVALRKTFDEALHTRMWDHVSTGELKVRRFQPIWVELPNGEVEERHDELMQTYGRIDGFAMLNPKTKRCGVRLTNCLALLRPINFGDDFKVRIEEMSDAHRRDTANYLYRALRTTREVFDELQDVRRFTTTVTLATLNGWGRDKGCPVRIHVAFDGANFFVGRNKDEHRRVPVEPDYGTELRKPPQISAVAAE